MANNEVGKGFGRGFGGCLGVGVAVILIIAVLYAIGNSAKQGAGTSGTVTGTTETAGCQASDFVVSNTHATEEYSYAKLTGMIRNNCATAAGVQLKWTAFNEDGSVAFSDDFWPASTTNIPPHSDYPFETMNQAPHGKWKFQVEAISTSVW